MEEVCYTREGALEKAIGMEAKSFDLYKKAYLDSKTGSPKISFTTIQNGKGLFRGDRFPA